MTYIWFDVIFILFDAMTYLLMLWGIAISFDVMTYFLTSWRILWRQSRHDVLLDVIHTFWYHDILFDVMTYSFTSRRKFDVNLTSWRTFLTSWRTFQSHDVLFHIVMTYYLMLLHNIVPVLVLMAWYPLVRMSPHLIFRGHYDLYYSIEEG